VTSSNITLLDSTMARQGYFQAWLTGSSSDFALQLQYLNVNGGWDTITATASARDNWIQYSTAGKSLVVSVE
jgi:hypothetical protein